ncbi:hypothetical protein Pint_14561 [Pistacia integerrima]|uniref:Uncharacterized protein n=1 Tax=Pistacia integerrima TaxID=434235 RepID=A0ACC0Y5L1_9ROSI|nr:hypothetical protein Pint_14561 [Pistacia integerrima]
MMQNPLLSNSFRGRSPSENGALSAFCPQMEDASCDSTSFLDHIIRRLGLKNNLHWEFLRRCERLLLIVVSGSPSYDLNADLPHTILPITPRDMLSIIPEPVQPPTSAPSPSLNIADIVDPPLPWPMAPLQMILSSTSGLVLPVLLLFLHQVQVTKPMLPTQTYYLFY